MQRGSTPLEGRLAQCTYFDPHARLNPLPWTKRLSFTPTHSSPGLFASRTTYSKEDV